MNQKDNPIQLFNNNKLDLRSKKAKHRQQSIYMTRDSFPLRLSAS